MIFGFGILATALLLSAVAAWYSVAGLTAIFSAAVVPVIIMGGSLELGKIVATVWLHNNWKRAGIVFKLYLIPAITFLMILTSMGIFGYLSKAHSDQSLVSGDVTSKIAIYDEKIKTEKENIEANRKALKQMDEGVDQVLGRSTTEAGAEKAVAMRKTQQKERARLQAEILQSQKSIAELNDARAPIAAEVRKVEAEVGPIKYIAALIYGDNPDANLLERAVSWVIILLVVVFDPLAIMMVLAATESMKWEQERRLRKKLEAEEKPRSISDFVPQPQTLIVDDEEPKEPVKFTDPDEHPKDQVETPDESPILEQHPYLNKPFVHFENLAPVVYTPQQENQDPEEESDDHHETTPTEKAAIKKWKELNPHLTLKGQRFRHKLGEIDELPWMKLIEPTSKTGFGTEFPQDAERGDTYIRTDSIPNRVFKHNGDEWIEVDKNIADSYTYDTAYIDHLISLLSEGQYDPDVLSESEREQIAQRLESKSNNQSTE